MPRHEIPNPIGLVSALQIAGTDLIMAAGIVFSEGVNGRQPPPDALDRAMKELDRARDAIIAYERSRRLIAA